LTTNPKSGETDLQVTGMNCASCVQHVTHALQEVSGVASAEVSLAETRAHVRWKEGAEPNVAALMQAVKASGYDAQAATTEKIPRPISGWRFNLTVGCIGAVPMMAGEWIFHWDGQRWFEWMSFGLALMVQILGGARFYRGAWLQLRSGHSNMDTLVALGSTAAFVYSAWAFLSGAGGPFYFMEAAAIIALISAGHWMEERASGHAEKSLRALLQLAPETATHQTADGVETEVAVATLQPGDMVVLRPGARVPTDGKVTEGQCSIDEAMLTGESLPVEKSVGSTLYAGTVDLNGQVLMQVTGTGHATAMAQIISAVSRAQNSRAQIQRLADQISNVFVPVAILFAIGAGLWWGLDYSQALHVSQFLDHFLWPVHWPSKPLPAAMLSAVAVLIVACPCAMGLATPVAIMAGANAAAKRGILIRDGIALEKAGLITAVLADKTGTLTLGKPSAVESTLLSNSGNELDLAAALARGSLHPLSQAVAKLSAAKVDLTDWREIRGSGVEAKVGGSTVARLGSLSWLKSSGGDITPGETFAEKWMAKGATILGLALNDKLIAVIALRDEPKPGIQEMAQKITARGLKIFLITGDNQRTAQALAAQAGIPPQNVFAEVRPEQKAELVRQLQQKGERVAFIGDGINDAPALEQADLGVAVSHASDVASAAADIILLNSDIQAIPEALDLARATLRTIRQNLFWAFFYNAAAIPLAALGLLSPVICAAAMGLSDLIVIGNALRLGRKRKDHFR
jgi:Cu+-exporting ATPase